MHAQGHESARCAELGLVLRWQDPGAPLPVRRVRAVAVRQRAPLEAPPWHDSGPRDQAFDFCARARCLLEDIVARSPDLAHVDVSRILLAFTQARSPRIHGLQARVTPLRFRRGALVRQQHGVTFQVQRYFLGSHEFLYLLTFCLPRFLDQGFDDKMVTLFHELYHIGPACDGDLRRHEGRYQLHTHSKHGYDQRMAGLARAYLASRPDPALHAFLRLTFAQLQHRHGTVQGIVVPRPRIVPLRTQSAAASRTDSPLL